MGDGQTWFLHSIAIADYKGSLEASLGLWSDVVERGKSLPPFSFLHRAGLPLIYSGACRRVVNGEPVEPLTVPLDYHSWTRAHTLDLTVSGL